MRSSLYIASSRAFAASFVTVRNIAGGGGQEEIEERRSLEEKIVSALFGGWAPDGWMVVAHLDGMKN